jgi:hypothetical protein
VAERGFVRAFRLSRSLLWAQQRGTFDHQHSKRQSGFLSAISAGDKRGFARGRLASIGLCLFLGLREKPAFHPALSAIPIALGLAYLAYYAIAGRKLESPNK